MAATPLLIRPLPWMEIGCANLSLIPHPSPCPAARLSVRNYEYNPFVKRPQLHMVSSYLCFFLLSRACFNLVAPPGSFWSHINPLSLPGTGILSVLLPPLNLRVPCCAQEATPSSLPALAGSHTCGSSEPTAPPSQVENNPGRGHRSSPALLVVSLQLSCAVAQSPDLVGWEQW